jgi:hypothetical protein
MRFLSLPPIFLGSYTSLEAAPASRSKEATFINILLDGEVDRILLSRLILLDKLFLTPPVETTLTAVDEGVDGEETGEDGEGAMEYTREALLGLNMTPPPAGLVPTDEDDVRLLLLPRRRKGSMRFSSLNMNWDLLKASAIATWRLYRK